MSSRGKLHPVAIVVPVAGTAPAAGKVVRVLQRLKRRLAKGSRRK